MTGDPGWFGFQRRSSPVSTHPATSASHEQKALLQTTGPNYCAIVATVWQAFLIYSAMRLHITDVLYLAIDKCPLVDRHSYSALGAAVLGSAGATPRREHPSLHIYAHVTDTQD